MSVGERSVGYFSFEDAATYHAIIPLGDNVVARVSFVFQQGVLGWVQANNSIPLINITYLLTPVSSFSRAGTTSCTQKKKIEPLVFAGMRNKHPCMQSFGLITFK